MKLSKKFLVKALFDIVAILIFYQISSKSSSRDILFGTAIGTRRQGSPLQLIKS